MINKSLITSILVFAFCPLFAQTSSLQGIKAQLDAMFAGLDKTKVPTGFLWDTAVNLIEGEYYNGSALTDSNFVSLPIMGDMLQSINSASVGADTICVQAALSRLQRNSSRQSSMIGILFKPYNYIVTNALTDNLINYSNSVVSDSYVNGIWQNPYGESTLFGFTPGNDGVVDLNTSFTIANIDSLSTQSFQSIQFDPGDGNGFRSVSLGSTVMVSYLNEGTVETKLAVTVGGQVYQSHSALLVKSPSVLPDSSLPPPFKKDFQAMYNGVIYKARVCFYDSLFHQRPLIVAEGFDPWKLYIPGDNYVPPHDFSGFTDFFSVIDPGYNSEFLFFNYNDLVYVDWYNCGADIRANAEVLKEVIRWVNENNSSGEPNIVMGQSMGGLIARYALRDMELDNEPHNTTLYISHDVPYLGANISPGLQYTYWDLRNIANELKGIFSWLPKYKDIAYELLNLGEFTSVKQMLPLYIDRKWHYNNTEYSLFQQELSSMGFPRGDVHRPIENIAIVNGGKSPSGLPSLYNSGDKLLHVFFELSSGIIPEMILFISSLDKGNLILIPGKTTLTFQHDVYPFLNYSSLIRKTDLVFKKKLLWLLPISFSLFSKEHYAPSSGIRYDNCSSSYYDVSEMMGRDSIYHYTQSHLDSLWMGHLTRKMTYMEHLSFIPTFSAMAMPNNDYNRDYYSNLPKAGDDTPFTSYILQNYSSKHISFFGGIAGWLNDVVNLNVEGPSLALESDCYTINTTDSTKWSIGLMNGIESSSGEILGVTNRGVSEVKATIETGGKVITKTKKVLCGLPRLTLNYSNTGSNYLITASYMDDEVAGFVEEHSLRDSLTFSWGIIKNYGDYESLSYAGDSLNVVLGPSDYAATVFLTVSCRGSTDYYSIQVKWPDPYVSNIASITKHNGTPRFLINSFDFPRAITSDPVQLILKNNPNSGFVSSPYCLNMLGESYDNPVTVTLDGVAYYFYDIFSGEAFQDFMEDITAENSPGVLIIQILDDNEEVIQTINYNVSYVSIGQ